MVSKLLRGLAAIAAFVCGGALSAQVVERQVPFDAEGRLLVLTPMLVTRLDLKAPEWPVAAEFDEARLYATGDDSFVIVVKRGDAVERYAFTSAQRVALQQRITTAAAARGMPTQESGLAASEESARGQFVRSQTALGVTLYGISAAIATESAEAWALISAGTFFATQAIGNSTKITVPMASLSSDFAGRGAALALLLAPNSASGRGVAGAVFGASLLGAVTGFNYGRELTTAEAEAAGWGSTSLALATAGLTYGVGGGEWAVRGLTAAAIAGGIPLGMQYPRRAPYVLTNGDLLAMRVPQAIGAGVGATLASAFNTNARGGALGSTLGYLAGAYVGDRIVAKPWDFTLWQAGLLGTGATLSAYAATALFFSNTDSIVNGTTFLATVTASAALGAWASAALMDVKRGRSVAKVGVAPVPNRKPRVHFEPAAALAAMSRAPGRHTVLSIAF